jgi:hypothetical protein
MRAPNRQMAPAFCRMDTMNAEDDLEDWGSMVMRASIGVILAVLAFGVVAYQIGPA